MNQMRIVTTCLKSTLHMLYTKGRKDKSLGATSAKGQIEMVFRTECQPHIGVCVCAQRRLIATRYTQSILLGT